MSRDIMASFRNRKAQVLQWQVKSNLILLLCLDLMIHRVPVEIERIFKTQSPASTTAFI